MPRYVSVKWQRVTHMGKSRRITSDNVDNYLSEGEFDPFTPGQLLQALIDRKNLDVESAAKQIGLEPKGLQNILDGQSPITEPVARKLAVFAENYSAFWMRAQAVHDVWYERKNKQVRGRT